MLTDMVSLRNLKGRSKKPSIQKRGCVISPNNGSKVGLKAQKLLAQGIALGNVDKKQSRPERAKALILKAFALSGRLFVFVLKPRAMPWARSFCPFRAYWM